MHKYAMPQGSKNAISKKMFAPLFLAARFTNSQNLEMTEHEKLLEEEIGIHKLLNTT